MTVIEIDGRTVRNVKRFHQVISEQPDVPDFYGRNSDALRDVLWGFIEHPIKIIWRNASVSEAAMKDDFHRILNVIRNPVEGCPPIDLELEAGSEGRIRSVAVYCGSASPKDTRYTALARIVGIELANRGMTVVYGGGRLGLMGAVATGALDAGGEVIGIIPDALANSEVANTDCTELHTVSGMHERKQKFTDLSDGFVTIPGGVGTMDELWEAVSWAQLGYHTKPVGLLNAFGFYDDLIAFNRKMAEVGFVRPAHQGIIIAEPDLPALLARMESYEPHTPIFRMKASDL